jgi:alkylation response protein AidB-like acyl-CoA dehydrogenase
MDTAFTEEQDQIRRTVRDLLARRCGPQEVKAAVQTPEGYDRGLWRTLAHQLGLPGLALPARYGGVGCGTLELALAFEEAGRALLPSPLLPTAVLVAPLLAALGSEEQRARLLPRLASGELTAALAVPGSALARALDLTAPGDSWAAGGGRTGGVQAHRTGDAEGRWRLYGEVDQVLGGHSAGLLLVAAHTGGYTRSRTLLFLVERVEREADSEADGGAGGDTRGDAPGGLVRTRRTALDATRAVARIALRDTPAALLGDSGDHGTGEIAEIAEAGKAGAINEAGDARHAVAAIGPRAAAVLAAEAVGAADGALARTVEYVKVREQFGRPIGSFQAVRHRLADVHVQVQAARSAAYYAAWAADLPSGHATSGGLALAQGLEALRLAAAEAIQLHGGVGFTWEHEAHLYFKRAAGDEALFGPVHRLRAHAADREGLFTPHEGAA